MAKRVCVVVYLCVFSLCALSFFSSVHAMKKMDVEKKKKENIPTLRELAIGKAICLKAKKNEKSLVLEIARDIKKKYFLGDLFDRSDLHRKIWNDLKDVKIGIHFIQFIKSPLFKNRIKQGEFCKLQGCKIGFKKTQSNRFFFVGSDTIKLISASGIVEGLQKFNIDYLGFQNNQLDGSSKEIGKLKGLWSLNLSGNQLKKLPKQICKLKELLGLYLSGNQLSELPAEIGKMENLYHIGLSNNLFEKFPEAVYPMKRLALINFSGNQLQNIPKKISQMENLKALLVSHDQFKKFPAELLEEIVKMETLYRIFDNDMGTPPVEVRKIKIIRPINISSDQFESLHIALCGFGTREFYDDQFKKIESPTKNCIESKK